MIRGIAMDIRTYRATRLASFGSTLGVLLMASAVTIGTVRAQNAATAPSRASLSGIQSVITHARDSLEHRMRAVQLRSQHQQLRATKPAPLIQSPNEGRARS
jgi:hypothetical protein